MVFHKYVEFDNPECGFGLKLEIVDGRCVVRRIRRVCWFAVQGILVTIPRASFKYSLIDLSTK
jgi:hypothetical protein